MDRRLLDATIDKVASGEHPNPHDALERASIEYEAKLADEAYAHGQKGADYQTPPLTPKLPLVPNMTEATLARQSAAKAKNAEYQETFKQGPVGEMLKPAGYGRFKMSDASVPENVVKQGAKGYETMRAYRKAAGDDPTVLSMIRNYLGYTLRNSALNPDGTINAAKYATWRKNYDGALRGAPELAPQFDSAAHAADSLTKFGKFNPAYAPAHIPDLFFPPGDAGAAGVQQLRSLIGKEKQDPMLKRRCDLVDAVDGGKERRL